MMCLVSHMPTPSMGMWRDHVCEMQVHQYRTQKAKTTEAEIEKQKEFVRAQKESEQKRTRRRQRKIKKIVDKARKQAEVEKCTHCKINMDGNDSNPIDLTDEIVVTNEEYLSQESVLVPYKKFRIRVRGWTSHC
mmetsp:Transcript_15262/g.37470  ORF Transcript_15262/g.37470 Transcript_15262/m.37470 type:complete len:134 (-) Transcript_15262:669-1070(-)